MAGERERKLPPGRRENHEEMPPLPERGALRGGGASIIATSSLTPALRTPSGGAARVCTILWAAIAKVGGGVVARGDGQ